MAPGNTCTLGGKAGGLGAGGEEASGCYGDGLGQRIAEARIVESRRITRMG